MNYIWEIALRLQEKNIDKGTVFYRQAEDFSPYYEQAFPCINETDCQDQVVEVNGLYRFDEIFGGLLSPNLEGDEEFKEYLFDILIHYLTEIDLLKGLSKREFYIRKIKQNIMQGHYGQKTKGYFRQMEESLQYILCGHLLQQFQTGSSVLMFSKTVRALFPDAIVYKNNINMKQILVYVGEKQSNEVSVKMELAVGMFLPIGYHIRMFYEHHFGIMDVPETLELGNVEIF